MDVTRHWADGMPRPDLIDEVETLRGRLRDAEFRERGLHEALRRETVNTQGATDEIEMLRAEAEGAVKAIREHVDTVMPRDGSLVDMGTVALSCERLWKAVHPVEGGSDA